LEVATGKSTLVLRFMYIAQDENLSA